MTTTRIRTSVAALALSASLMLSGCGALSLPGSTPSPTQSQPSTQAPPPTSVPTPSPASEAAQAQQCRQVVADVQSIAADVARVGETIGSDPLGALVLLGSITERVGGLETSVTDPALVERIAEIQAGWEALVADAQDALTSGDAGGIQRATDNLAQLAAQVQELNELCTGAV